MIHDDMIRYREAEWEKAVSYYGGCAKSAIDALAEGPPKLYHNSAFVLILSDVHKV